MPPRRKHNTVAVVRIPKAPDIVAAEGRLAVIERLQQLAGPDFDVFLAALVRLATTAQNEKIQLQAIELGLAYGIGKPAELQVRVESTAGGGQRSIESATSADLERVLAVRDSEEDAQITQETEGPQVAQDAVLSEPKI
jgi:hypothetical protein